MPLAGSPGTDSRTPTRPASAQGLLDQIVTTCGGVTPELRAAVLAADPATLARVEIDVRATERRRQALAREVLEQLESCVADCEQLLPDEVRAKVLTSTRTTLENIWREMQKTLPPLDPVRALVRYAVEAGSDLEVEELQGSLAKAGPRVEEALMTTLRQLRAENLREGGRTALAQVLVKLLTLRFSAVSEEARAKIASADVTTLDRWIDRVIAAPTLEAVLAD